MAAAWHAPFAAAQGLAQYDLTLSADYRRAQLDWSIAGTLAGTAPDVLSELTWRDLEIAQVSGAAQATIGGHLVLRGNVAYGEIQSGENQDSDYLGDGRTFEFSRSTNGGGGSVAEAGIAFGYRLRILDYSVGRYAQVTPMVGYSQHRQNMTMFNGNQTVETPGVTPALGPFADLNSSYDAEWKGPWVGVNLRLETSQRTSLLIDLEYHRLDYAAEADWNLITTRAHPVSFRHDAKGNGVVAALGVAHALNGNWGIIVRIESQHWETNPGLDTDYQIDPATGSVVPIYTRLNAVYWQSRTAGLAVTYRF